MDFRRNGGRVGQATTLFRWFSGMGAGKYGGFSTVPSKSTNSRLTPAIRPLIIDQSDTNSLALCASKRRRSSAQDDYSTSSPHGFGVQKVSSLARAKHQALLLGTVIAWRA